MELFFDSFSSCPGKIFSFKRSRLEMTPPSHEERAFLKRTENTHTSISEGNYWEASRPIRFLRDRHTLQYTEDTL